MLIFVSITLFLVYVLQIFLLPSFYQNKALSRVETISNRMATPLTNIANNEEYTQEYNDLVLYTRQNNICLYAFDDSAILKLEANAMGSSCYLHYLIKPTIQSYRDPSPIMNQYMEMVNQQESKSYYFTVTPNDQISSQLFYAQRFVINNRNFYVFINTPYELLDSTIFVLQEQFFYISSGVLILGIMISLLLSKLLSEPLNRLSKTAQDLARGKKDVIFEKGGFLEIDTLASTLNYATQEINKTDNLRIDLLANISHDLRTPLTSISAYAQLIQDISGDDPVKREKHLKIIIEEVEQLNRLLSDMMTLSQMQSKTSRLIIEEFDINNLVNRTIESLKATTSTQSIMIEKVGKISKKVIGDEVKIRQVIMNYLSNAIKFVGEDRTILVKLIEIEETGYARIEVIDHGSGISEEEKPYVWDRYYKVNKNYARVQKGTGLGLAICKAICERGNYPYGVLSEVDKYSLFFVEIPLSKNGDRNE